MGGHDTEAYDRLWQQTAGTVSEEVQRRIAGTLNAIPSDCASVLDVGCGDGRVTDLVAARNTRTVGCDLSPEALRHVRASCTVARIEQLPFRDAGFDLVLCSEVLEHLPSTTYTQALQEIARVSSKYILVTVPNNQNLRNLLVTCPVCQCRFNPDRHVRTFAQGERLEGLFSGFSVLSVGQIGEIRVRPDALVRLACVLAGLRPHFPGHAVCPQCGYATQNNTRIQEGNPWVVSKRARLLRWAARAIPAKTSGAWLLILYQRLSQRHIQNT